jgi:hypothetical protein
LTTPWTLWPGIYLKKLTLKQCDIPQEKPYEEIVEEFNEKHPLDPLTAKRLGKTQWPEA